MSEEHTTMRMVINSSYLSVLTQVFLRLLWIPYLYTTIEVDGPAFLHDGDRVVVDLSSSQIISTETTSHHDFSTKKTRTRYRYLWFPTVDPHHLYYYRSVVYARITIILIIILALLILGIILFFCRARRSRLVSRYKTFQDQQKKRRLNILYGYEDVKASQDYCAVRHHDSYVFAFNIDGHGPPRFSQESIDVAKAAVNGDDGYNPEAKDYINEELKMLVRVPTGLRNMVSNYSSVLKDFYDRFVIDTFVDEMKKKSLARSQRIDHGMMTAAVEKINSNWQNEYKNPITTVEISISEIKNFQSLTRPIVITIPVASLVGGASFSAIVYNLSSGDCYLAQLGDQLIFVKEERRSENDEENPWTPLRRHSIEDLFRQAARQDATEEDLLRQQQKKTVENSCIQDSFGKLRLHDQLETYKSLGDFRTLLLSDRILKRNGKQPISPSFYHQPEIFYFPNIMHIVMGSDGWDDLFSRESYIEEDNDPLLLPFFESCIQGKPYDKLKVPWVYDQFFLRRNLRKRDDMSFVVFTVLR